jgi:hypothetical protein
MHISCVLSVIYHDLCSDSEREGFNHECIEFIKLVFFVFDSVDNNLHVLYSRALRIKDDVQSKLRIVSVLAVLLQGPFDTGNAILGSENLVDLMLQMGKSGDPLQEVKQMHI